MVLRIFDWDLCMIVTLDLLAHLHSSIAYVQMGLITAFENYSVQFGSDTEARVLYAPFEVRSEILLRKLMKSSFPCLS